MQSLDTRVAHSLTLDAGRAPLYGIYSTHVDDVTCIDWPDSLHGSKYIDIFADLNKPIPVESESYDTIVCTDVLEHIWSHETLWRELHRLLKPGGHVIVGTPFMYWIHEEPHDYFRWTPYSLRTACEESSLELVEIQRCGGGPEVISDITTKLLATKSPKLATSASSILQRILKWPAIARMSESTSAKLTLANTLVARRIN